MRWLKRRSSPPAETPGCAEASQALDEAERLLQQARREDREILATVEKLRHLGEQNDFAARIREALGGAG